MMIFNNINKAHNTNIKHESDLYEGTIITRFFFKHYHGETRI